MQTSKQKPEHHSHLGQAHRGAPTDQVSIRPSKKILVVDDSPGTLSDHRLWLEEAGYEVTHCGGSLAALFAVVRVEPDLVIAELRLPVMNGVALAAELKAHDDTRHVPVVMLASQDIPKYRTAAMDAGCAGYLTTHLRPNAFLQQIAQLLPSEPPNVSTGSLGAPIAPKQSGKPPKRRYEIGNRSALSQKTTDLNPDAEPL
jgi:CheY-like chemotaxis protein